jgi:hypothetical protein
MLKELPGYQAESKTLPKGDIKEPDMGSSTKKMAKGGTVPAKGKVSKSGSKAGKTGKAPVLAIMIGIPKEKKKMAQGGAAMTKKQQAKVGKVMGEYKEGTLHSGKKGPVVKDRKQAVAIALSEARKAKKK